MLLSSLKLLIFSSLHFVKCAFCASFLNFPFIPRPRCANLRWLICLRSAFIPSMHPNDEVVTTEAARDRYDGGGIPEKYVGASERLPIESSLAI